MQYRVIYKPNRVAERYLRFLRYCKCIALARSKGIDIPSHYLSIKKNEKPSSEISLFE